MQLCAQIKNLCGGMYSKKSPHIPIQGYSAQWVNYILLNILLMIFLAFTKKTVSRILSKI